MRRASRSAPSRSWCAWCSASRRWSPRRACARRSSACASWVCRRRSARPSRGCLGLSRSASYAPSPKALQAALVRVAYKLAQDKLTVFAWDGAEMMDPASRALIGQLLTTPHRSARGHPADLPAVGAGPVGGRAQLHRGQATPAQHGGRGSPGPPSSAGQRGARRAGERDLPQDWRQPALCRGAAGSDARVGGARRRGWGGGGAAQRAGARAGADAARA